jgi:hypothetical protein
MLLPIVRHQGVAVRSKLTKVLSSKGNYFSERYPWNPVLPARPRSRHLSPDSDDENHITSRTPRVGKLVDAFTALA